MPTSGPTGSDARAVERAGCTAGAGEGHRRQPQPAALVQVEVRARAGSRRGRRRPRAGSVVDAVVDAAQPPVEPRGHLGVEVDPRARASRSSGRRAPTGRPAAGAGRRCAASAADGPEGVVAVAVGPAGDDHRRALRSARSRAVAPSRPTVRASRRRRAFSRSQVSTHGSLVSSRRRHSSRQPVAPDRRHGRQHVHRRHVVAVVDEVDQPQRAAAPVHVVGPAVVAGVDRADRLQRRRPLAGHLQGVEAGVRRAVHADAAVAPLLAGQPGDHLGQVALLLRAGTRRWRRPPTTRCRAGRAGTRRTRARRAAAVVRRRTTRSGRPCGRAAPRAGTAAGRRPGRAGRASRPGATPSAIGIRTSRRCRSGRGRSRGHRPSASRASTLAGSAATR